MSLLKTVPLAIALTALTALTACSARDADSVEPDLGSVIQVTDVSQIVLPFDGYRLNTEEDRLNGQAYMVLLQDCGKSFGIDISMGPPENGPVNNDRRYSIFDEAAAKERGYDGSSDEPEEKAWDPSADEVLVLNGPEGGETASLNGKPVPPGGCTKISDDKLGGVGDGLPDVQAQGLDTFDKTLADSRVVEVTKKWSTCMKEKGYDYATPFEHRSDWPEPVTAEERADVMANIECKKSTNFVGVCLAVETAYQQAVIDAYPAEFAKLAKWHDERVANIKDALTTG